MRVLTRVYPLARIGGAPEESHTPRRQPNTRAPIRPDGRRRLSYQELLGIGVLIAAIVALLWSGSLVSLLVLALGSALAALMFFAIVLFILWRRPR